MAAILLLIASASALRGPSPTFISRRHACSSSLAALGIPAALCGAPAAFAASGGTSGSKGKKDQDEKMDSSVKAAATPAAARKQIVSAYNELGTLLQDMDKVTAEEGGDGIRRVLGTVGTTSAVYLIEPAFRLLFEADETLSMDYIENVEQIMRVRCRRRPSSPHPHPNPNPNAQTQARAAGCRLAGLLGQLHHVLVGKGEAGGLLQEGRRGDHARADAVAGQHGYGRPEAMID